MRSDPNPERFRELMLDEEPGFEDVLACVFNIQEHEVRTYLRLLDEPGSTVAELAERERRLLDSGGHVYQYTATPVDEARELMHETLDEWTAYVHDRIDEFGEDDI